jgi:23S rRNA pseudouridine2604 synthase
MTNDGRMTQALLHPTKSHEKEYEVQVNKAISNALIQGLINGVRIGSVGGAKNYKTKPTKSRKIKPDTLEIILTEGKNRQIRKMCGALGYKVVRLKRFRILDIKLGRLKPNQFRKLEGKEKTLFLEALGLK